MIFSFIFIGTVALIDAQREDSRKEGVISALVPTANFFPAFYPQFLSTVKYELFCISLFCFGVCLGVFVLDFVCLFLLPPPPPQTPKINPMYYKYYIILYIYMYYILHSI